MTTDPSHPTAIPDRPDSVDAEVVADREMEAIRTSVAAELPEYLADLERLVNIDCGSYTPEGVNEVGHWVAGFLTALGADVDIRPDPDGRLGNTVVGTFSGRLGAPRALLIGHMDTVFDPGTVAERPFRIDEGTAYGPGVTDMKSGLLGGLYALKAVIETVGGLPFERLTFVANPDEEIGSPTSTPHIRALAADVDACLVLECARANGDIVSARKGIIDARVTVIGRAAHAGVEPEKGRNAILEAARIVEDLHSFNGRWPGVTVNVGVIRGGTRPNVVAERCELEVDVRAVDGAALDAVEAALRETIAATVVPDVTTELEIMAGWRPMEKLERSGRLVEHAQAVARRLGFEVHDTSTGGASDANTTSGMGVPSLDGLGPIGGNDHAPAEYLDVDSIVPRTAMVAGLLLAIARDPEVLAWRADDPRFVAV
jgi:glutamate carboxypeptidase